MQCGHPCPAFERQDTRLSGRTLDCPRTEDRSSITSRLRYGIVQLRRDMDDFDVFSAMVRPSDRKPSLKIETRSTRSLRNCDPVCFPLARDPKRQSFARSHSRLLRREIIDLSCDPAPRPARHMGGRSRPALMSSAQCRTVFNLSTALLLL